ncbi:hypothetical protein PR202_ga20708 [Eleusine coracana subsp. coracana]|uniref:Exocyst complex component Sec8 n=1 Tax=Eleusine coracana subsp. coracana TaxID=191504 RepID=A0AAV5CZR0_ELECO|nr:hypothetical protein PR202_ga20708 [Eleusine coracana subsp. coracana]
MAQPFSMVGRPKEKVTATTIFASMCALTVSTTTVDGEISALSWWWSPCLGEDVISKVGASTVAMGGAGAAATADSAGGDGIDEDGCYLVNGQSIEGIIDGGRSKDNFLSRCDVNLVIVQAVGDALHLGEDAVLEKQSYILLSRNDVESLMRLEPANISSQNSFSVTEAESVEVEIELSDLLFDMCPIKQHLSMQENLIHDDQKLILLASLSDSLEYLADSVERLGESFEMTKIEYVEDQDAEDPDDFIISLTTQIVRRDEEMAPYITESKRNFVFGGISSVAANASIKALAQMKSINLLGVQQICRNSIALEQPLIRVKLRCSLLQPYPQLIVKQSNRG